MVAWENNCSGIAKETEYFITDIEYAAKIEGMKRSARLDMLELKWLRQKGESGSRCAPVFIEMKYGNNALSGVSGISEHINAICKLLQDESTQVKLNQMIESQFEQLVDFELIKVAKGRSAKNLKLVGKPEIILLLANWNPRSNALRNELKRIENPSFLDLRFFVANFAGYGMHDACMINLDELRSRLDPTADQLAAVHPD